MQNQSNISNIVAAKTSAKKQQQKVREQLAVLNDKRQELKNEVNLSDSEKLAIVSELLYKRLDSWSRPTPFGDFEGSDSAALGAVNIEFVTYKSIEGEAYNKAVKDYKIAYKYLIKTKLAYLKSCVSRQVIQGITVNLNKLVKRNG